MAFRMDLGCPGAWERITTSWEGSARLWKGFVSWGKGGKAMEVFWVLGNRRLREGSPAVCFVWIVED